MGNKFDALKKLENGVTLQKIANGLEDKMIRIIRMVFLASFEIDLKDKNDEKTGCEKTSEALYIWFVQFRD